MKRYEVRVLLLASTYEIVEAENEHEAAHLAEIEAKQRLAGGDEINALTAHADSMREDEED